jgi:hypothetical protein
VARKLILSSVSYGEGGENKAASGEMENRQAGVLRGDRGGWQMRLASTSSGQAVPGEYPGPPMWNWRTGAVYTPVSFRACRPGLDGVGKLHQIAKKNNAGPPVELGPTTKMALQPRGKPDEHGTRPEMCQLSSKLNPRWHSISGRLPSPSRAHTSTLQRHRHCDAQP